MKWSIRLKLLSLTLGVIILVGGSISFYSIYLGREKIFKGFLKEALQITTLLSSQVTDDLYNLDVFSLRLRLENAHISPDLREAYVMDVEGIVLADGTDENALRDQTLPNPFSRQVLKAEGWISLKEEERLLVGGPITMADGTLVGYLYLVFSCDDINHIVADNTQASFLITLIVLGFGASLAFFLSWHFTRPILEIAGVAKALGRGEFDARVQIKSQDELGLLGASINKLAVNLRKTTVPKGYFNKIVTAMSEMLIVVTPEQTINTVNNAVLTTLGYQANDLLGKSLSLIFSEEPDESRDLIEKGVNKTFETTLLTKEGHPILVSFSASAMREKLGRLVGIVCVLQDITARRQAEEITRKYSEKLEQDVKKRTEELQKKNEELERYNKLFVGRELRIKELKEKVEAFSKERERLKI